MRRTEGKIKAPEIKHEIRKNYLSGVICQSNESAKCKNIYSNSNKVEITRFISLVQRCLSKKHFVWLNVNVMTSKSSRLSQQAS